MEFIHTDTYKRYVKNKFQPVDIDDLLDWRFKFKKLKEESEDESDSNKYEKEIKAIDFILSKHF